MIKAPRPLTIAIDGPTASGKGTIARRLAGLYGLPCLDTGLLYRAVGVAMLDAAVDLSDATLAAAKAEQLDMLELDETRLRTAEAGAAASVVAAHPPVRAALLARQRAFAAKPQGAILDGRDIGTVVCPDALVKFFITASLEIRAQRRHQELARIGEPLSLEDVKAQIAARDARDMGRSDAPLRKAEDAHLLDTSEMSIDEAVEAARLLVERALGR